LHPTSFANARHAAWLSVSFDSKIVPLCASAQAVNAATAIRGHDDGLRAGPRAMQCASDAGRTSSSWLRLVSGWLCALSYTLAPLPPAPFSAEAPLPFGDAPFPFSLLAVHLRRGARGRGVLPRHAGLRRRPLVCAYDCKRVHAYHCQCWMNQPVHRVDDLPSPKGDHAARENQPLILRVNID
jgi:hypothetical protein